MSIVRSIALTLLFFIANLHAHDGPDPLMHWALKSRFVKEGTLVAQRGPDLPVGSGVVETENGLFFDGAAPTPSSEVQIESLPMEAFTIAAWCSVHEPKRYGGLIGALEDNGGAEKGWILGYDGTGFYVGLSTQKADDGDGKLTYLRSKTAYERGRLYHVVATYDGSELALFVNGVKEASTDAQGGKVLYAPGTRVAVAGYRDRDEDHPHRGQMISAHVYGAAATEKWVAQEFAHNKEWAEAPMPEELREALAFVIRPYLQWGTTDGMTVMWETNEPADGSVRYGETAECKQTAASSSQGATIHELRIDGLKPGTQYFYQTVTKRDEEELLGEVRTFQTDAGGDVPFAFAVISDTQGNPAVSGKFAKMAWSHRPNFLLHPGDLVSTGGNKSEWVEQFFASMEPLVSRVPFFPVLGNHEQNADHYYNYVSLPEPEYFYTFRQGNAQFFLVDTNKKCAPGSEQYVWLEEQLAASDATWKIACHHHPPFTSDENDYGDLWKTNISTRGDTNARNLSALYDKYGVDIVWNGHIHSYERTWPIRDGKPVEGDAPFYLVTGGGGGHLETPGPFRTPFELIVRRGHHYAMVWVNGRRLEYKAYDIDGRVFDTFTIDKRDR